MNSSACVIGVDIGTTSTKAIAYDMAGAALARASVEYPLLTPAPGAAEQDPEQILEAVIDALGAVVRAVGDRPIECVSFSAAMHSLIAVDREHRPLSACITWADTRSGAWAERIKREHGLGVYRRTGTPIHPMSPLVKLAWLREAQPAVHAAAAHFISIKEYVFQRFFGRYVVDHSIASATGLFDVTALNWDDEALQIAGIGADKLSPPVTTVETIDGPNGEIARRTGLRADTRFVVGANDGALANIGVAAIDPGSVAVTIGTSGAIRSIVPKPLTDPRGRTFCYVVAPGLWVIGGPVNNGGVILRWLRDELAAAEVEAAKRLGIDVYDMLTTIAERVPPGADGLLFHPYLAGERAPLWNGDARGSFFGLALNHRREHLIRAVLEGVVLNLHAVFTILEEVAGPTRRLSASGGFARSRVWRQIMADVFDRELLVPESPDSSAFGAAALGMHAIGAIASLADVAKMVGTSARHLPNPQAADSYNKLKPIYFQVPAALEPLYGQIAAYQRLSTTEGEKR